MSQLSQRCTKTITRISEYCEVNNLIYKLRKTLFLISSFLMVASTSVVQANSFSTDVTILDTDPGSVQYVEFTVLTGGTYQLNADGFNILGVGFNSDPELFLFESSLDLANLLAANDDFNGLSSQVTIDLVAGQYIIAVSEFNLTDVEAVSGLNAGSVDDPNTLIRVTVFTADGLALQGFVTLEQLLDLSIRSAGSVMNVGDFLSSLPFNGAHHRPLLTYHGMESGRCVWANGDLARYSHEHDGDAQLAEVGGCYDFIPQKLRLGVGIGKSFVDQDLAFGGESDLDGEYVLAELDYQFTGLPLIGSLTGIYGDWDGDIDRAYNIAGIISTSFGSTDVTSYGLRAKLDWLNAFTYSGINFSPRVALTFVHTKVDAYTETGGLFPVAFNSRSHTSKEVRFGIDAEKQVGNATWVRGMLEGVHRFDDDDPAITGTVLGTSFIVQAEDNRSFWGRIGLEVEHLITNDVGISASVHGATSGEDPTVSGGLNLRVSF